MVLVLPLLASASPSQGSDSGLDDDARRRLEILETLDLDALLDVEIELLSRHPERRFDAPAAASVIGNERIRRSSMTRLPDLLRYVPGLHVNKIDANKWAISSRNASARFSNTMLVLMDGRTIYSPLFGGVYWNVQDTLLQDVDRIEVVRGPGLSLWGSNAVNGIVNVVTRSARDTQGTLGYVRGGIGDARVDAGGRVGVKIADGAFLRVYGKGRYSDTGKYLSLAKSTNDSFFQNGSDADDEGEQGQGGFRLDWYLDPDNEITLQGDGYGGRYHDIRLVGTPASASRNQIDVAGGNLLGRWLHHYASGSESTLQLYWDYTYRSDDAFRERRHTVDLDWQHQFEIQVSDSWIPTQRITWGASTRVTYDDTDLVATFSLDPRSKTSPTGSAFLQDRITLVAERLFAIVGTKWEHNDFSGSEFQPSSRLLWTPNKKNTAWLAVSYPARIPNRADSDALLVVAPGVEIPIGNPHANAERLVAYEAGYRVQIGDKIAFDLAAFYDDWRNVSIKRLWGVEFEAQASLCSTIGVEASYTYHDGRRDFAGGVTRSLVRMNKHSARFSARWDPTEAISLDSDVFYVSQSRASSGTPEIPAYVRWDLRAAWRPRPEWEFAVSGTNLADSKHPEGLELTRVNTGVSRGVLFSLTYQFD